MPTLSFSPEFAYKALADGQTIRGCGPTIEVGSVAYLYTGPYRKGERIKLGEGEITEVQHLIISPEAAHFITVESGVYRTTKRHAPLRQRHL